MDDPTTTGPDATLPRRLDKWTRFASEDLARTMDRRAFLKRASAGAFLALAGLAVGQGWLSPRRAAAATPGGHSVPPQAVPNCAPPGPYCNYENIYPPAPDSCQGAHCFQHQYYAELLQCRVYYGVYQAGCWTSPGSGGYWTCCDCQCGTPPVTTCGCAQFSANPGPLPMRGS